MKTAIRETFKDEDIQATARIMGAIALLAAWLSVAFNAGESWNFWVLSVLTVFFWAIWLRQKRPTTGLLAVVLTVVAIGVGMLETVGL